jgi:ABC-type Fe3+/spermidine/putrescine transport system ATPase subunit
VADPKTLYDKPVSRAVADFIGTMNFFPGRVAGIAGGKAVVETAALGRVEASLNGADRFSAGAHVLIAIRPEKLLLTPEQPNKPSVQGRIVAASYLGDRSQIQVRIPGAEEPIAVVAQNISAFQPGDAIYLTWTPDAPLVLPE